MRRSGGIFAAAVAAAALAVAPAAHARGIETAVFDPPLFNNHAAQAKGFKQAAATGATKVRLTLFWNSIAVNGRPTNPAEHTQYTNWGWFDEQVRLATVNGLEVFAEIMFAPPYASSPPQNGEAAGIRNVNATELEFFARAAATRYAGKIRYWQVWGEPNRSYFLQPQYANGVMVGGTRYRALVQAVARGVKLVDPANKVVAGVLSPMGRASSPAPLAFMRQMLCLNGQLRRTCVDPVAVDVWAHQAYTYGGPTKRSSAPDDVQLGDLGKLRRVITAARRENTLVAPNGVELWVTEWSWDTNPPDRRGIPAGIHARWVSESLYRMWRNGVTVATWWRVKDEPMSVSRYQSGFFNTRWSAKGSLRAFRFPTVAFAVPGGVRVWGRTPTSRPGTVTLHRLRWGRWTRIGQVRANADGIFQGKVRLSSNRTGSVRATWNGQRSLGFALTPPRPPRYVDPFGCSPTTC
jgi:hypothetical protein